MCGIAGIYSQTNAQFSRHIKAMTESMFHRGPDEEGYLAISKNEPPIFETNSLPAEKTATIFLGHRRLKIIDIEGSKQPLMNEDSSVWTVFNGEIYNFEELREYLASKGHIFKEKGDTEVLVHLWEEYGQDMLHKLVGMFAFAIYDIKKDVLFIARDRFGEKPLYYAQNGNVFLFASELQAIASSGLADMRIKQSSMGLYFKYGYIPSPETAYIGVKSLLPGHFLIYKNNLINVQRYWKPNVLGKVKADYEKLQFLIDESVRLRLKTDVPFGLFLSSGIDSATIAASMKKNMGTPVKTFTVSTGKNDFDEAEGALKTARFLGTEHREIKIEPDFINASILLARHYGQPFADHSSVMTYYVSKATREHVIVALGGDGGDEIFAGYQSYANFRKHKIVSAIPAKTRKKILEKLILKFPAHFVTRIFDPIISAGPPQFKGENPTPLFHEYWQKKVFTAEFAKEIHEQDEAAMNVFIKYFNEAESDNPLEKWLETDQRLYLCDDILCKVDIASMAVSLECRAPFLDHRLAEYANTILISEKIANGTTKAILKKLALQRLPAETVSRPKKGFSMPLGNWIRGELKDWFEATIFRSDNAWTPFLQNCEVRKIWNEHQSQKIDHQARLWAIACVNLWQDSIKKSQN